MYIIKYLIFFPIFDAGNIDSGWICIQKSSQQSEIEKESRMTVAENMKEAKVKETEAKRDADLAQEQAAQQEPAKPRTPIATAQPIDTITKFLITLSLAPVVSA